jgi:hypothetical protein
LLCPFQFNFIRPLRQTAVCAALLFAGTASAECETPATQSQLAAIAWEARSAFEEMDQAKFVDQMSQLSLTIPCMGEVIEPMGASTIHLLMGLERFGLKDLEGATLAFAAARSASNGYQMPESVAPAGHPLHAAFSTIPVENAETQDVAISPEMTLYVDGREATSRPAAWPALVQLIVEDGTAKQTIYLAAADPVPGATTPVVAQSDPKPEPAADVAPSDAPLPSKSILSPSLRTPLIGVAGAAVLTTAVLQILASKTAQTYWDKETGLSELNDLRARTNSLNSASVATGVISAGALASVSLTLEW